MHASPPPSSDTLVMSLLSDYLTNCIFPILCLGYVVHSIYFDSSDSSDSSVHQFGSPLDRFTIVNPNQIPEPFRRLLCHETNMTPTLQRFYERELKLKVIRSEWKEEKNVLTRMICLHESELHVELALIRIYLHCFEERLAAELMSGRVPFAIAVHMAGITQISSPKCFYTVASQRINNFLNEINGSNHEGLLYGRYNVISDNQGRMLSEVIEIMPSIALQYWKP